MKACSKTRRREGTLLWSRWRGGKREGMPKTANNSSAKARQLRRPAIGVSQVHPKPLGFGEGRDNRSDAPVKGRIIMGMGCNARHIQKIIVKAVCAENRMHSLKGGLMEKGPALVLVPRHKLPMLDPDVGDCCAMFRAFVYVLTPMRCSNLCALLRR